VVLAQGLALQVHWWWVAQVWVLQFVLELELELVLNLRIEGSK
jgi:hypothetical protein